MANPCEHQKAAHIANADCAAHAVNWRERALKAEARQAWVPVEEDLPNPCADMLVLDAGEIKQAWLHGENGHFCDTNGERLWNVTHWRPMLAPPEGE
jgi:hypothetical protein